MSDRTPPHPILLNLPLATLHGRAPNEPHPDSEEAVRYERQRVATELKPIRPERVAAPSSEDAHPTPSFASLRSRDASLRSIEHTSQDRMRQRGSAVSSSSSSSTGSASTQADTNHSRAASVRTSTSAVEPHWYDGVVKFWTTQISLAIEEGGHRDHLALERTFLGYLRTSLLLVMTGIIIAQLFYINHSVEPDPEFGFYKIGRPLSATFIAMAIVVLVVGALRFWRLQHGLVRGKGHAGGWEVVLVMGLSAALLVGTFVLVLVVDVETTYFGSG